MYTGLDNAQPASAQRFARAHPEKDQALRSLDALESLRQREHDSAWRNGRLFAIGAAILLGIPTIIAIVGRTFAQRYSDNPPDDNVLCALVVAAIVAIALLSLLIKKESRADAIDQFLDSGTTRGGSSENPFARILAAVAMAGMLYGAFICDDAIKTSWVRRRVHVVDRFRAAELLRILCDSPAGVDPRTLLLYGEEPLEFRRTIAYLLIYDWADISPQGDSLVLLSPSRRRLREGWTL